MGTGWWRYVCAFSLGIAAALGQGGLTIDSPGPGPVYQTPNPSVALSGLAAAPVSQVQLSNDRGQSYGATLAPAAGGAVRWTVPEVVLHPGPNAITVTAGQLSASLMIFRTAAEPEVTQAQWFTAFHHGREVKYQMIQGRPMMQGDIALDRRALSPVPKPPPASPGTDINPGTSLPGGGDGVGDPNTQGAAIVYSSASTGLWPKVGAVYQVPYIITNGNAAITSALSSFNATFSGFIQFVPRVAEADYVDFNLTTGDQSGVCWSYVGRIGGAQQIGGSPVCNTPVFLHEMGHAIGLYHEQVRSDRDSYISVLYENIIKGSRANFDVVTDNYQPLGLFDYRSVMMYYPYAFSRNGDPTIETIPAGMPLTNSSGYSDGDKDQIRRLYRAAPGQVTIASNPPGLQVIVDGVTVTTPQAFSWALNSVHTVAIPAGSQTLSGRVYTYGRWNDDSAAAHSITVLPGNGLPESPGTSPAITVYTANFIELVKVTTSVTPAGGGTMIAVPAPAAYPPAAGLYYPARTAVTLQATPSGANRFYGWYGAAGATGLNPLTTRAYSDITAAFTTSPVHTVGSNLPGRWIWVDGSFQYAPKNFALPYDASWTAGSSHTVNIQTTLQYPYSSNTRYRFSNWSDGGAVSHNVTVPAVSSTRSANFTAEFLASGWTEPSCAGSASIAPGASDFFYSAGTPVSLNQATAPGFLFAGWLYDLTGTASPQNYAMNDELLVVARYNTVASPLSISGLSPAQVVVGHSAFTLTIQGTGFSAAGNVYVNGTWRAFNYVNSTQLQVAFAAGELTTPGAVAITVANFGPGGSCGVFDQKPLRVASAVTNPQVTPSTLNLAFADQTMGTLSAAKSVTVTNTGNGVLLFSQIVAAGDFTNTTTCGASLNPGGSCMVSVRFQPTALGARAGTLTITSNAAGSPHQVGLSGRGSSGAVTVSPASLAFTTWGVGRTAPGKTITFTNKGTLALALTSVALAGTNPGDFGQTNNCPASLAPNQACTISVTFTPLAAGTRSATVQITSTGTGSPHTAALSGTGVAGAAAAVAASVNFGAQALGILSSARTVTVTNQGNQPLTVTSVTATGDFSATNNCTVAVAPGGTCTLSLRFTPAATGARTGTATIVSNSAAPLPAVSLSGIGSSIQFGANSAAFGRVVAGTSAQRQVTLKNVGTTPLDVTSIVAPAAVSLAHDCPATMPPGAICTLTLAFAPAGAAAVSGYVDVTSSDPAGLRRFAVSATGVALQYSPTALNFGNQTNGGTSAPQVITVTNRSSLPVTINSVATTGDYQSTNGCSGPLPGGASCTTSVVFRPTVAGTRTGRVTYTTSDLGTAQYVTLTGKGI